MTRAALSPLSRRWGLPYLSYIIITFLALQLASSAEHQAYRTAYGCEGATLSIDCEPGHVINVIRANYGRFSITICNPHGNTEWSVNCQSPRTHTVLVNRCSGEPNCEITVSSDVFGDPCPGTVKYIEVHYTCGLATTTTTTSRPRAPWFPEQRPTIWLPPNLNTSLSLPVTSSAIVPTKEERQPTSSSTSSTTTTSTTSTTTTTVSTTTTTTSPSTSKATTSFPTVLRDDETRSNITQEKPVLYSSVPTNFSFPTTNPSVTNPRLVPPSFSPGEQYNVPWCAPSFARGLYWNWTKAGEVAVLSCPGGATGSARRKCLAGGWAGPADLSDCRSAWLTTLETRTKSNDNVLGVATDLAKVTGSKALYGGDLITAARLIKSLSLRMMKNAAGLLEADQRMDALTEFLLEALKTGSALLSPGLAGPWGDLEVKERREAVTELMIGLEKATFLLCTVLPGASQAAHFRSHILASARVVLANGSSVEFPSEKDENLKWVFTEEITIPPEVVSDNREGSFTRVIFLTYRHLEDLLAPEDEIFRNHKGNKNVSRIVNSRIVSASLGEGRHIQLIKPATLTFSLLRHDNVSNPVCAFWDYTTHAWNDDGCHVVHHNKTHVTCSCRHLTNFAVIMEKSSGIVKEELASSLRILAYIGCFICIACVAASLVVFTIFKSLSSPRVCIQKHVCLCLLVAEIVFLAGIWKTDFPVLCGVVAGILHYWVLALFAWMFLDGLQVYLTISREVEVDSLNLRWWHYLTAYVAPVFVVCTAAVVDPFSFGTSDFCWLRTENYFVFFLVGPALVLVVLQVAFIGAAIVLTCRFDPDEALKTKEMARLSTARYWLRTNITLGILMVLSWTLGLLLIHQPSLPVAASFCVLNSLYGIFIFVYYCIRNQTVRDLCGPSREQEKGAWITQMFRNVFATEKQTYSPNNNSLNNNNNTLNSSSSTSESSTTTNNSSHHHNHHQAISQALNQALAAVPPVQQYLPTLCHLGGLKGHVSPNHHTTGHLLHGGLGTTTTAMMGSRASLRQAGCVSGPLPMGSFHQSLPRRHEVPNHFQPPVTGISMTSTTDTPHHGTVSLNAPLTDEDASYKSFSRDSGHGGSEQEDSPRTPWSNQHHQRYTNSLTSELKNSYLMKMNSLNQMNGEKRMALNYPIIEQNDKQQNIIIPSSYSMSLSPNVKFGVNRAHSPCNHTYMEIETHTEPVYEDIEREGWARGGTVGSEVMQVSDLSDEDIKKAPSSDISRQSSRSYGDSRPLLPFLHPRRDGQRLGQESQFALSEERLRDFNAAQMSRDLEHLQQVKQHLSRENLMTVAVLNGEQVVCRLSSPSHPSSPQSLPIIHEGSRGGAPHSSMISSTPNGHSKALSRPHHHQMSAKQFSEC